MTNEARGPRGGPLSVGDRAAALARGAGSLLDDARMLADIWTDPHAARTLGVIVGDLEAVEINADMLASGTRDPAAVALETMETRETKERAEW